jgi:predicted small secreted protein
MQFREIPLDRANHWISKVWPFGAGTAKRSPTMNPILLFDTFVCRSSEVVRLPVRLVLLALLLGSVTVGLNSCATARGFGQDVETTGEKIEEAASR